MVTFTYQLVGRGWAEIGFTDDEQDVTVLASYVTSPLADLVAALVRLLTWSTAETVEWTEEPGMFRLELARTGEELQITLLSLEGESAPVLFSASCPLRRFVLQVRTQIWNLRQQWGDEGYQQEWGRDDLPLAGDQQLGELLGARKKG